MKTIANDVVIQKGVSKKGEDYFFIEVLEPVRKYIKESDIGDLAVLNKLANDKVKLDTLVLHQRGNSLIFSNDLQSY